MKLDRRLSAVAELIPKNNTLADIGSDHAYLPAYLLLCGKISGAIVSDVNAGPLENGKNTCLSLGIADKCDFRLGSGLAVLEEGEADVITMCGMGGELMTNLLNERLSVAKSAEYLILQPQSAYDMLREFLYENGFGVIEEKIVKDRHLYYRIMLVSPKEKPVKDDFLYPSYLALKKDENYKDFLTFRMGLNGNIIEKIASSSDKTEEIKALERENERIREVLRLYEDK